MASFSNHSSHFKWTALESPSHTEPVPSVAWTEEAFVTSVIKVSANDSGRRFDGIGAVTSNGMSKLLYDYPEAVREEVLDLLFKPGYGASFHALKVEIGSDANGTAGTEPSHMRSADDFDIRRGVGLQMARDARDRNKDITLDALRWGTPGWIRDYDDKLKYYLSFLQGAKEAYGLDFDYLSPDENEGEFDVRWVVDVLRPALDKAGFGAVRLTGADSTEEWNIAPLVKSSPGLKDAIAVINRHYKQVSPRDAKDCGLPLYNSEDLAPYRNRFSHALEVAGKIIRSYADGRMTQYIMHPVIEAMYEDLPYSCKGILVAAEPWSGHYEVCPGLHVVAHFTQASKPGWRYLDGACHWSKSLSSLALAGPGGEVTIILLNQGDVDEEVSVEVEGFKHECLHAWQSDEAEQLQDLGLHPIRNGVLRLVVKAASIITLTSAGPIHKAPSCQSPSSPLPLPYRDSFDYRQKGGQPLYMVDQGGAFELQEVDGRPCLMQVLDSSQKVIDWERRPTPPPYTVLGPTNLCEYRAGVSFLLDKGRSRVLLGARCALSLQKQDLPECYSIQVWDDGRWTLQLGFEVLCCGRICDFDPAIWHRLMICCEADSISAYCDNRQLCNIQDASISSGNIVLGSDLSHVCFRDFLVEGLGEGAYCERHDALDPRIVSTPGWKKVGDDAEDYNRTLLCAAGSWEVMAFSFEGTGFAITGHVGGGLGQADVYVDGRSAALIDAWSGSPRKRRCLCSVRGLPEGRHSVEIVTRGESDPDSTGTDVQVNAIELIGSLVEMTKEEKQ